MKNINESAMCGSPVACRCNISASLSRGWKLYFSRNFYLQNMNVCYPPGHSICSEPPLLLVGPTIHPWRLRRICVTRFLGVFTMAATTLTLQFSRLARYFPFASSILNLPKAHVLTFRRRPSQHSLFFSCHFSRRLSVASASLPQGTGTVILDSFILFVCLFLWGIWSNMSVVVRWLICSLLLLEK